MKIRHKKQRKIADNIIKTALSVASAFDTEAETKMNDIMKMLNESIKKKTEKCIEKVIEQIEKRPATAEDFKKVELLQPIGVHDRYGMSYLKVPLGTITIENAGVSFNPNKMFSEESKNTVRLDEPIENFPEHMRHLHPDASHLKCSDCGRHVYRLSDKGEVCNFPQPSGERCKGTLQ